MSTEIAERPSSLPGQAYNSTSEITAEDISLPRIKPGELQNAQVTAGLVDFGAIYTELSTDDPDPQVIAKASKGADGISEGVKFVVLAGPRINYSWNDDDGGFHVARPGDEDLEAQLAQFGDRGKDKRIPRRGYNYVVAIPEVDGTLPYKLLIKGSSSNAARQLNLLLTKASLVGPTHTVVFELRCKKVKKETYSFTIWQVTRPEVPAKDAADLAAVIDPLVEFARSIAESGKADERPSASVVTDAPSVD